MNPRELDKIKAQRQRVYGDPRKNHRGISMMWACMLEPHWKGIKRMEPLPEHVVAAMMALLKLNRTRLRFHRDNYLDLFNYAKMAHDFQRRHDREKRRAAKRGVGNG